DPLRRRGRDVQSHVVGELLVAAPQLHQRADLVRRRVRVAVDDAAVDRLEAGRAGKRDVLAEPGAERDALVLELLLCTDTVFPDSFENLLRKGEELVVVRDGLRLAADTDEDAEAVLDP